MEGEQLELMKVIEFPKNRNVIEMERQNKLNVIQTILELIIQEGNDFHIVIDKKSALEIFEDSDNKLKDYFILTTNFEEAQKMKLKMTHTRNSIIQKIIGNELD